MPLTPAEQAELDALRAYDEQEPQTGLTPAEQEELAALRAYDEQYGVEDEERGFLETMLPIAGGAIGAVGGTLLGPVGTVGGGAGGAALGEAAAQYFNEEEFDPLDVALSGALGGVGGAVARPAATLATKLAAPLTRGLGGRAVALGKELAPEALGYGVGEYLSDVPGAGLIGSVLSGGATGKGVTGGLLRILRGS